MAILDHGPLVGFSLFMLIFIGAVFDIDWIMKLTRADRRHGREFARIYYGVLCFFGIIMFSMIMISAYF